MDGGEWRDGSQIWLDVLSEEERDDEAECWRETMAERSMSD